VAIASFGPAWPVWGVLAVCLVFGITAVGWNGVLISETARLAPAGMAGVVSGGTTFVMFFGVVFYPPTFSILHDAFGSYRMPFVLFAVPAAAMAVVQLIYRRRK